MIWLKQMSNPFSRQGLMVVTTVNQPHQKNRSAAHPTPPPPQASLPTQPALSPRRRPRPTLVFFRSSAIPRTSCSRAETAPSKMGVGLLSCVLGLVGFLKTTILLCFKSIIIIIITITIIIIITIIMVLLSLILLCVSYSCLAMCLIGLVFVCSFDALRDVLASWVEKHI